MRDEKPITVYVMGNFCLVLDEWLDWLFDSLFITGVSCIHDKHFKKKKEKKFFVSFQLKNCFVTKSIVITDWISINI